MSVAIYVLSTKPHICSLLKLTNGTLHSVLFFEKLYTAGDSFVNFFHLKNANAISDSIPIKNVTRFQKSVLHEFGSE